MRLSKQSDWWKMTNISAKQNKISQGKREQLDKHIPVAVKTTETLYLFLNTFKNMWTNFAG